jgi:hypothetical protein
MKLFLSIAVIVLLIIGGILSWNNDPYAIYVLIVACLTSIQIRFMSIEEKLIAYKGRHWGK